MNKFIKVEINVVHSAFKQSKLSGISRAVYHAMSMMLHSTNSSVIEASYDDIVEMSGLNRRTVIKAIKELSGHFIMRCSGLGFKNKYKLLIGVYNGRKEEEIGGADMHQGGSADIHHSHVRAFTNPCLKAKEEQQEQKAVVVFSKLKFKFKDQSLFKSVNPQTLTAWANQTDPEHVQSAIEKAEFTYKTMDKLNITPEAMLSCHVLRDYNLDIPDDIREELKKQGDTKQNELKAYYARKDKEELEKQSGGEETMGIESHESTDVWLEVAGKIQRETSLEIGARDYFSEVSKLEKRLSHKRMCEAVGC